MIDSPLIVEFRILVRAVSSGRNSVFSDVDRVGLRVVSLVDVCEKLFVTPWHGIEPFGSSLRPLRASVASPLDSLVSLKIRK